MSEPHFPGYHQVRVYYEDTDHGGVVYHANYLRFMERARTEMLRTLGFSLDALERDEGVVFAVRRAALDYIAPARFNDLLDVLTRIHRQSPLRTFFTQEVRCERGLLCRGDIEVVSLSADSFRPTPIPKAVRMAFSHISAQ
ncbi:MULTISPECIES: tol-pal system-associated acyl-CoA thioesterase [Acidithiobacillus]|jgi:acyl-CoA thioester hydrolase|uniref:tol-pal system-associated acyl-CoA thioesterase n=1 Tax=Acidithiobacillus TaxID=119977 RepID=UPI0005A00C37|nr:MULTISPECIES: tol-pal system-associated acyl-CoA thioesterase [Acidithiobacillus]MBU2791062.1 tol-pal system-associated acyl-CoA thioesterase [Acidithiobacillus caldus]MBU2821136.1 tol-pal system-associated acyl-CoA thioesterase [Acidithiobacillus caldus]MCE5420570.1 tol-pal system-associated acyl-CoA thioesterase [Acidithiobacillus sp.]